MGTTDSRPTTAGQQQDMALPVPATAPSSPRTLPPASTVDKHIPERRMGHIRATISFYSGVRQLQEIVTTTTNISPNGGFFYGSANPPAALIEDLSHVFRTPPVDSALRDSKAHQLLIAYSNGWYAIPSPVNFSRHAGTCLLLGDRANPSLHYNLQLGDCIRLGSVGLVVVAMRMTGQDEIMIKPAQLSCIQEEREKIGGGDMAFADEDDGASRFIDEKNMRRSASACNQSVRTMASDVDQEDSSCASEEEPLCYMCYDARNDETDPLVAPCDCKGDTRYLHVGCLQRWYANLGCGPNAVVIRTTANGAPACKICGVPYKTTFIDHSGKRANIVEASHKGPYISFVVVTRHENAPQLFNTKFRLNFKDPNEHATSSADAAAGSDGRPDYPSEMTIGRSSACNMVLDYRTVSTMHARMTYQCTDPLTGNSGGFVLQDLHSSNGSLLYLHRPHFLGNIGSRTILRLGRTTMSLDVRSGTLTGGAFGVDFLPSCFSCKGVDEVVGPCSASPDELYTIMAHTASNGSNTSSPAKPILTESQSRGAFDVPVHGEGNLGDTAVEFQNISTGRFEGTDPTRPEVTGNNSTDPAIQLTELAAIATMPSESFVRDYSSEGVQGIENALSLPPTLSAVEEDNAGDFDRDAPNEVTLLSVVPALPVSVEMVSEKGARDDHNCHSSAVDFVTGAVSAAVLAAVASEGDQQNSKEKL